MKRDLDLVRTILLEMEKSEKVSLLISDYESQLIIDGYTLDQIIYHAKIMCQAGLLHVDENEYFTEGYSHSVRRTIPLYSISWNGQEFLATSRDEARWKKAKNIMVKVGGLATDVALDILKDMGKQAAVKMLTP